MRRIIFLVSAVISISCLPFVALSSLAWELEMEGQINWYHQWFSQTGHRGFFGPYNIDNGLGTTTANMNFWSGFLMDRDLSAGADQLGPVSGQKSRLPKDKSGDSNQGAVSNRLIWRSDCGQRLPWPLLPRSR